MKKEIVFYVSRRWAAADSGIKFTTDRIENVEFIADKFKYDSSEIYVEDENKEKVLLSDYKRKIREAGIENVSVLWSFIEKIKRETKKTGNKKVLVDMFEALPKEEQKVLYDLYQEVDNKLESLLWDAVGAYEEKHDSFYLSEDGMMDFIPYAISLGEKRVATFMKKPNLALGLSQKDYEYPFNLLNIFLMFEEV